MSERLICLGLSAVLVASCASASGMPETSFSETQALERVVRYYERHATEENRTCLSPYMEGITRVDVLEERPEHLVADVRYFYRDRGKDDGGNEIGRACSGYDERRFTLGKEGATGLEVLDMTGPQRTASKG